MDISDNSVQENKLMKRSEFFGLLGEFCVEFEEICYLMEECASDLLEINGLKNIFLRQVVLSNLTAEPLQRMLRALLAEHFKEYAFDKILSTVFSEFEKITKERNSIVHGKWIPPFEENGSIYARSRRLKTSKSGEDSEHLKYSEIEFSKRIDKCKNLQNSISTIRYLCSHPNQADRYFNISTGVKVISP